jgi:hypothetical protein
MNSRVTTSRSSRGRSQCLARGHHHGLLSWAEVDMQVMRPEGTIVGVFAFLPFVHGLAAEVVLLRQLVLREF